MRRPFCRVEDYLKPCSSTDKSCLSTIKSRISRHRSPAKTRESKNSWNKVLEGKAWQICFCGTLSLHLGAKEGAPQNPRPSFRTLLGPKQSWIGKHTGETSQYPWLVRWHCHATCLLLWRLRCEAFACAQVFCSLVRCHKHHTLCLLSHLRTATSMWSWIELKRFMTALFPARFDLQGSTSRQSSKKRLGKKMSKWPLHLLHRHYTLRLPFAKLETDFEMPGQLANQEVAPKRQSLRIWFWQESLLAMASSCGSFQDLWFVAAQHLNANILSQDGCGEPEHNLFGSLGFFWSLGRWIRRGAQRFSALKIPGLTSSPWWPWWRLRVI